MAKHILFLIFIIFISDIYSLHLKNSSSSKLKTNLSIHDPNNGCTISLRKSKENKIQAISFISEMQNSLGSYSKCKLSFTLNNKNK